LASDVGGTNVVGFNTLLSEVTPGVLIEVEEVLSPDLYEGVSIFGTISWLDAENSCLSDR
jgi:hypothetical protein